MLFAPAPYCKRFLKHCGMQLIKYAPKPMVKNKKSWYGIVTEQGWELKNHQALPQTLYGHLALPEPSSHFPHFMFDLSFESIWLELIYHTLECGQVSYPLCTLQRKSRDLQMVASQILEWRVMTKCKLVLDVLVEIQLEMLRRGCSDEEVYKRFIEFLHDVFDTWRSFLFHCIAASSIKAKHMFFSECIQSFLSGWAIWKDLGEAIESTILNEDNQHCTARAIEDGMRSR